MEIQVQAGEITQWLGDGIVVGVFRGENELNQETAAVDRALDGAISKMLQSGAFEGHLGTTRVIYTFDKLPAARVSVVGLGKRSKWKLDRVRYCVAEGLKALRKVGGKNVATAIFDEGLDHVSAAQATAEGAVLGLWRFRKYHTEAADELHDEDFRNQIETVTVVEPDAALLEQVRAAVERGRVMGEATNVARELSNEPGNWLTPTRLAESARQVAEKYGLEYYVIDRDEAMRKGMGAFLGVAQGSDEPPAMIVMRYWGAGKDVAGGLGLIGKGITFDSGGISLKPGEHMEHMKGDMSGGAATIAAMQGIAELKPKVNVTGIIAATENLPSGKAFKPGDILRAMNGKTIEVNNTDAEGRLVLADAVAYATKELGLDPVIDAATLTGAIMVALGIYRTGVFANDDALAQKILAAGERTGERMWQMPMDEEYKLMLQSDWADLKNSAGRMGGAITGAWFIRSFVENGARWAHLDIAGSVHLGEGKERGHVNKWGNGTPTRTFIELALEMADGKT